MNEKYSKDRVQIEVYLLNDLGSWEHVRVWVPIEVAQSESHDQFLKWLHSDSGEAFQLSWADHVMAAFVASWSYENFESGKETATFVEKGTRVTISRGVDKAPALFGASIGATGVMQESGRIGQQGVDGWAGWDVYDILLDDGNEVSAYGFQLEVEPETPSRHVIRLLQEAGHKPRSYSGRGMYGKSCVGLALSSLVDLGDTSEIGLERPTTDSLGKGIIAYWPSLEWPADLSLEDDKKDDNL